MDMKPNELITDCKKENNCSGIYMILCVPNNKAYIGQSKNINRRWSEHKQHLRKGLHKNSILQASYNKYGKDSLFFYVLEKCELNISDREAFYLEQIDKELRMNLKGVLDIVPISEETRIKLSKPKTEETKKKLSDAAKLRHIENPMSKEAREKQAASHRGKKHKMRVEGNAALVKNNKERVWTVEMRKAISDARKAERDPEKLAMVIKIKEDIKLGLTNKEISSKYGLNPRRVSDIRNGKKWREV